MLKAEIALRDSSCASEWRDGVLSLGASWIRPHAHAALETLFAHTQGQWIFVVRERHASMPLREEDACATLDDKAFDELHRACLMWPLDYVMIEVAHWSTRHGRI